MGQNSDIWLTIMSKKKQHKQKPGKAEEPLTFYSQTPDKTVRFFSSHEQMEEHEAKERAALSHGERLQHVELLRKQVFSQWLLPSGKWPPVADVFKIMPPYTNDTDSQ